MIHQSESEPVKSVSRREFIRKSSFSTGSLVTAGLLLAHGEAFAATTSSTTITTTVSCGCPAKLPGDAAGWGKATSGGVLYYFELSDVKCDPLHHSMGIFSRSAQTAPHSGKTGTDYTDYDSLPTLPGIPPMPPGEGIANTMLCIHPI